jgi:predicted nucleic acid-binding protein
MMTTYLLDTSVIIDALIDKKNRRQLLRELITQGNTLACCPINITEVYAGLRPKEEQSTAGSAHLAALSHDLAGC